MKYFPVWVAIACACLSAGLCADAAESQGNDSNRVLVIVLDGCRPDYITPDVMPNVYALGQRGEVCTNHHSVYPTLTRVNATSFVTGCYPAKHGLMGNAVYFPEVDAERGFSTGNANNLMRIDKALNGNLVTIPTLGEILESHDKKLLVVSSGSPGSAFLQNHKAKGGGISNVELVLPESNQEHVTEVLGPAPQEAYPNAACNHWAVDAYLKIGLEEIHPDVTFMWLSDPDHTAHAQDMGSPNTIEALKAVDGEVGRVLKAHERLGLTDKTNIIVTSDHGFSTQTGEARLVPFLVEHKLKASESSTGVIVVDGCIYVTDHDQAKIRAIVDALQKTPWVGAIFTKAKEPGSDQGAIPGTLSFDLIHFNHDRAPDILADANWSDAPNQYGWKGTTTLPGVAGHGSSSPFDIHNTLLVAGPAFKEHGTNAAPTGNIDILPTVCKLVGLDVPSYVDGRVLTEVLAGSKSTSPESETTNHEAAGGSGGYRVDAYTTQVGRTTYLDFTQTHR